MNRNETRELMMQFIFQMEAQNEFNLEMKDKFIAGNEELRSQGKYVGEVFNALLQNKEEIDKTIEGSSDNWKLTRMNKVDLAVLRLAIVEILYIGSVPTSVAINEAVNLAKKFGTDESSKFINGILGKIAKNIDKQS